MKARDTQDALDKLLEEHARRQQELAREIEQHQSLSDRPILSAIWVGLVCLALATAASFLPMRTSERLAALQTPHHAGAFLTETDSGAEQSPAID